MNISDLERHFAQTLPDLYSIGPMIFDPVWAERDHTAARCEMLHVMAGTVTLVLPGTSHTADPGDTLLVPAGTQHRDAFDIEQGLELFFCSFDWPLADAYFRLVSNETLKQMPAHRKAEIASIVDRLRADLAGPAPVDQLVARARVLTILLVILREAADPPPLPQEESEAAYGEQRRRALMLQAREYMETHYAACVSLDEMAASLHVSAYYLSHLFSEQSGFSLFGYSSVQ